MKIVIVIRGGVLESVFCSHASAKVELIDFDNADHDDEDPNAVAAAEHREIVAASTLSEIY